MYHLREISSSLTPGFTYTVVNTDNWTEPLSDHPALLDMPDKIELAYGVIPDHAQYVYYPPVEDSCLGV